MSEVKKETTSKKKEIWKKIRGFLVIVMVAVISIAGTLAYLSRKTDRVTNTFTATEDIKIELTEPEFTPPPGGYQPDVTYPKDPQLANVTGADDGSSEWVIMRVDYRTFNDSKPTTADGKTTKTRTYTPVSYNEITSNSVNGKGLINIAQDLNSIPSSDNWIKVNAAWLDGDLKTKVEAQKCDYFIYKQVVKSNSGTTSDTISTNKTTLKTGSDTDKAAARDFFDGTKNESITTRLFSTVTIKSQEQLVNNGYKKDDGTLDQLPGFTIDVIGGAIKNSGDKTIEIATGKLDITNLNNAKITQDGKEIDNVSHTIVNELVKLLADENFESTTETIEISNE